MGAAGWRLMSAIQPGSGEGTQTSSGLLLASHSQVLPLGRRLGSTRV
jgi:hypothetical protein